MNEKKLKEEKKTVKVILSLDEYDSISNIALQMKIPISRYVKMKVLDDEAQSGMKCRQVAQLMPNFYNCVNQVGDFRTRQELTDIGGAICRCLK